MGARLIGATRQIHLNCRVLIWICLGEPPSINIRVSRSCASSRRDAWPLTASQPAGYSSPPVSAELLATLPPCILASASCVRSGGAAASASSLSMAFRHHVQSLNFLPRLNRDKFAPHTPFPPETPVVHPWHPWQPTHWHEASMVARLIGATLICRGLNAYGHGMIYPEHLGIQYLPCKGEVHSNKRFETSKGHRVAINTA